MTKRPTFTKAELERATAVATSMGCEVVIAKTADSCTMSIKPVDTTQAEGPQSGPKSWD